MNSIRLVAVVTVMAGGVIAAHNSPPEPVAAQTQPACSTSVPHASGSPMALVSASNKVGFHLLKTLQTQQSQRNTFVSPISIELALAMAYNGSAGTTSNAMASTLGFGSLRRAAIRARAAALLAQLISADPNVALEVANSLWARTGFPFQPSFIVQSRRWFAARVSNLDFSSPSAPQTINSWVACATHGTINAIVNRIPPDMVLYLINSIYFKGTWTSPFLSNQTRSQSFTAADGVSETVPMMHQSSRFLYRKGSNFQAITLQYGSGRFAMTVVLPNVGTSLAQVQSQLSPATWQRRQSAMVREYGSVALPRFSISNTFNLNGPLSSLGMRQAFSTQANFSHLCKRPCRISKVLHKAYLRVYEKGTEAAAVTAVGVGATAAEVSKFNMVVDHPFYLVIRDAKTGATLFLGAINNLQG